MRQFRANKTGPFYAFIKRQDAVWEAGTAGWPRCAARNTKEPSCVETATCWLFWSAYSPHLEEESTASIPIRIFFHVPPTPFRSLQVLFGKKRESGKKNADIWNWFVWFLSSRQKVKWNTAAIRIPFCRARRDSVCVCTTVCFLNEKCTPPTGFHTLFLGCIREIQSKKKIRRENTRQTRECDWMGFPSKSP